MILDHTSNTGDRLDNGLKEYKYSKIKIQGCGTTEALTTNIHVFFFYFDLFSTYYFSLLGCNQASFKGSFEGHIMLYQFIK